MTRPPPLWEALRYMYAYSTANEPLQKTCTLTLIRSSLPPASYRTPFQTRRAGPVLEFNLTPRYGQCPSWLACVSSEDGQATRLCAVCDV